MTVEFISFLPVNREKTSTNYFYRLFNLKKNVPMGKVTSHNTVPENSMLLNGWKKNDYIDCFSVKLRETESVDSLLTRFFSYPKKAKNASRVYYPVGKKAVMFQVIERNKNEIVLGESYPSFDFKTTILMERKETGTLAYSATTVRYNQLIGKIYFFFVRPVHRLLIPFTLSKM